VSLSILLEHFDAMADAPHAAQKLRDLILLLAMRGQLIPQDPSDEPATALLDQIAMERQRQFTEGKLAKPEPRTALPPDQTPYVLPDQWAWAHLGDLVKYNGALKVPAEQIPDDAWLLDLEDIERDSSRLLQRLTFAERRSKSTKARFVRGNVLYGKLRPYLNKVIVADADGFCTTEIVPLQLSSGLHPRFLLHALKRPDFLAYVNAKSYGSLRPFQSRHSPNSSASSRRSTS
jgi:type I restriction enzyme, S subunit